MTSHSPLISARGAMIRSWLGRSSADQTGPAGHQRRRLAGRPPRPPGWLRFCWAPSCSRWTASTLTDGVASTLYGGVLVILAERRNWRLIVAAVGACVLLTALSYFPAHERAVNDDAIFRRSISLAAIAAAALLTLRNLFEHEKINPADPAARTHQQCPVRPRPGWPDRLLEPRRGAPLWLGCIRRLSGKTPDNC